MPLLSIIIPTYNASATLGKAIESILCQTFLDYEVLVMDGGSKDDTIAIVKEFQRKSPLIYLISEPDKGIYDAMNKGVQRAKGEWLYFLGSDDYLINEKVLEEVGAILKKRTWIYMYYGDVVWGSTDELYYGKFNYEKLLVHNICHQAMFLKRDIVLKSGMFDLAYPVLSDWDMNFKLFQKPYRIKYIGKTIAFFNVGAGASSFSLDDPFRKLLAERKKEYYQRYSTRIRLFALRVITKIYRILKKLIMGFRGSATISK
jgi:glycosyltransferase involved in cell wall biosynthesis